MTTFSELTTMRVGGPIGELARARSAQELVDLVRDADAEGRPVLVMGGGSNLVVGDQGFDGLVVQTAAADIDVRGEFLTVGAGAAWDDVVVASLAAGLGGLEPLSGIPGTAGGTPVQNVGAYGTLTSELLHSLTVYDRASGEVETWGPEHCGFVSHRQSAFKHSDRWVVLDLTFGLRRTTKSAPIHFADLAARLDIPTRQTAPTTAVRTAVLGLRSERRMVLDPDDHDTWSVGSFFINPVLTEVPEKAAACPRYPDPAGIKLPAGWLIDHAGFPPGYGRRFGRGTVALSSKHALAVTNRGGATTADIMTFAAHVRDGVEKAFDIRLGPECDLVNCAFDETGALA
ncbi:UDP-N-acetylmuramate dehydrogenase [Actinomycetospora corticicola]|uniref:UDP-N-acetylenolpyruvoylglucosamine reductase n=1 Tax=Actinomycetospora corticicola TaxID=663602 RepID=A0A7Y9DYV1_9PSEU|nr:UDP-N-acetylmuramate dehydrogenase [Actinomycetospora corticicola]NYD37910.1 UDP-N-acetylmuramate dehydrogenase [Actinomycetospora corticicola]